MVAYTWNRGKQMFIALGKEFDMIPKMQQSQATNFVKSLGSSTGLNAPWKYYLRYCLLRAKVSTLPFTVLFTPTR